MELLDALGEMGVLRVPCQHRRLIQVLTAVLDAVDLDADAKASLLHVGVGSQAHRLCGSHLVATGTCIVRILLIESHGLVDVGLHNVVVLLLALPHHRLVAPLARVSDALDRLALSRSLQIAVLQGHLWRLSSAKRRIRLAEARVADVLIVLQLARCLVKVLKLARAIQLDRAPRHGAVSPLVLIALALGCPCVAEQ